MKFKKNLSTLCLFALLISFSACENNKKDDVNSLGEVANGYSETSINKDFSIGEEISFSSEKAEDEIVKLNNLVAEDVKNSISDLKQKYENLKSEINTYEKYLVNTDKIESFYSEIRETNSSLCYRLYKYSLDYADLIIGSDKTCDEKYDDLDELYDNIYDKAGDKIYDEIYNGLLSDIYDDYYTGILEDAYDSADNKEWHEVINNEYKQWNDTSSDVYENWSNSLSDIYSFWSDIGKELWSDDIEKAEKEVQSFRDKVDEILKNIREENQTFSDTESDASDILTTPEISESDNTSSTFPKISDKDQVSDEFKALMDSYEEFFDEYAEFMKNYSSSDNPFSMLSDYMNFLNKYSEVSKALDSINENELSEADALYYAEVTARIYKKIYGILQ